MRLSDRSEAASFAPDKECRGFLLPDAQHWWDTNLLAAWRLDWRTGRVVDWFCLEFGLSGQWHDVLPTLSGMRRLPPNNQWLGKPVRVFVAARLPRLSDVLWAADGDGDAALRFLSRNNIDIIDAPSRRKSELMREVEKDKRVRRVDINAGHRRSDWHVVK